MDILSWWLLPATLLATLGFFLKGFYFQPRSNHPPGPKPWPIIGNLNLIGPLPHVSLHQLAKKYGPIMQLQYGSFPVVVGSSPEMAKQILQVHDLNFASRPKSTAGKYTTYDHSDLAYASYGPYFSFARKIFQAEIFGSKRVESYKYIRIEETQAFLSDIYALRDNSITLKDHFSALTLNNITRMVLGKKFSHKSKSHDFRKLLEEWELLNGTLNFGDLIPWINFLDLQGYVKRMKTLRDEMDSFLESELNDHIEQSSDPAKGSMPKDMLIVLLELAADPDSDVKLSRSHVKGLTLNLLAGGTETSTTTLEWSMTELMRHPEILKQATEELDRVIGRDRCLTEEDIASLPFLRCIVLETLRMYPVAPLLMPHLATEDCKVDGYDIVKGTRILVNIWSIGRDPTLWDAPDQFKPERFSGREVDIKGQNFVLLPFGSGRRMCPALGLGLKLLEFGVANLLHGFTWKLPNQMEPEDIDMDGVFGLTVPKKIPLVIVPQPRLPPHLYSL